MLAVGRLLGEAGRYPEAVAAFRKAIAEDPLNEAAHRQLMICLVRIGEHARAARAYHELVQRLRDELGVDPAAETTAAYERLLVRESR